MYGEVVEEERGRQAQRQNEREKQGEDRAEVTKKAGRKGRRSERSLLDWKLPENTRERQT